MPLTLWTLGHSTLSLENFLALLQAHDIGLVADIRRFPGSRQYPHFNAEVLEGFLAGHHIAYRKFPELGGRRAAPKGAPETIWRNRSFAAYARYMESPVFQRGLRELEAAASEVKTAILCSEAVWWRCHRRMVSDAVLARGGEVRHILNAGEANLHVLTPGAGIHDGQVDYRREPENKLL